MSAQALFTADWTQMLTWVVLLLEIGHLDLTMLPAAVAAPSYADISPQDTGISDSDWSLVGQIGSYNNAYMEYVDNQGEVTLVFTGGNVPNPLQ
ncbi:hypothetical protein [Streptomyces sp. YKOK-I1]